MGVLTGVRLVIAALFPPWARGAAHPSLPAPVPAIEGGVLLFKFFRTFRGSSSCRWRSVVESEGETVVLQKSKKKTGTMGGYLRIPSFRISFLRIRLSPQGPSNVAPVIGAVPPSLPGNSRRRWHPLRQLPAARSVCGMALHTSRFSWSAVRPSSARFPSEHRTRRRCTRKARIPLSLSGGGERRLALSDEGRTKISPTYCLRWVVLTSDIALRSPFVRQIRTFLRICRRIVACSPMKKTFSPFCFALFFRVFFSLPVGCYGCYGPRRAVCL